MNEQTLGRNLCNVARYLEDRLATMLRHIFHRKVSFAMMLLELVIIKVLYILLVVMLLKDQWYQGYGSYGVVFVPWKEIVAFIVFLAMVVLYLRHLPRGVFLKNVMQILFILYYIPINSAFSLNDAGWDFFLLSNLYYAALIATVYGMSVLSAKKSAVLEGKRLKASNSWSMRTVWMFCVVMCCLFIIHKLSYNGLDLSLSGIYENRATYAEYLESIGGTIFGYMLALVRYVIVYVVPFTILVALSRRKPAIFVLACLTALSMFAVSSEKGKLMMPVVAVVIYFCYRWDLLRKFRQVFTVGMILLLVLCIGEALIRGSSSLFTLIPRRVMYVPAWLNTIYYDFFSQNDKIMWSQSVFILQKVLDPVYALSPLEMINNAYFQGMVPSPNTGMFAEAYMHFGVIGVAIYPLLLSGLFVVSGKVLKLYGPAVSTLIAFQVTLNVTNLPITRTDFVLSYMLFISVLYLVQVLTPILVSLIRVKLPVWGFKK